LTTESTASTASTTATTTTKKKKMNNGNNNKGRLFSLGWRGMFLIGIIVVVVVTDTHRDITTPYTEYLKPLELQVASAVADSSSSSSISSVNVNVNVNANDEIANATANATAGIGSNSNHDSGDTTTISSNDIQQQQQQQQINKLLPLKPPYYTIQFGPSRTASTFQTQMLNVIIGFKSKQLLTDHTFNQHTFAMNKVGIKNKNKENGFLVKTHSIIRVNEIIDEYQEKFNITVSVFTSSNEISSHLSLAASSLSTSATKFNVLHDQTNINMSNCSICEINNYYKSIFDLSNDEVTLFEEYMKNWEILRRCCGIQQSKYNRYRLHGCNVTQLYIDQPTNNYPYCENYNLSNIENNIMLMSKDAQYRNPGGGSKLWSKPGDCKRIDQIIINGGEMSGYKFRTCDAYFNQDRIMKVG
jgi:hypothetical protein